jgi:transposase
MHKAKLVQRFVQENATAIELFFLPPYSPELNPNAVQLSIYDQPF